MTAFFTLTVRKIGLAMAFAGSLTAPPFPAFVAGATAAAGTRQQRP